jgi:clan AA aspartic protease
MPSVHVDGGLVMGIAWTTLRLANPVKPHLAGLEVTALADTGAMYLCIPERVALQLELSEQERREVTLADGSKRTVSYVGPVEVRFANRRCFVGAMVMGNETLLGAMPMQDMDLVIRPLTHEVTVNPETPNFASTIAKRSDGARVARMVV